MQHFSQGVVLVLTAAAGAVLAVPAVPAVVTVPKPIGPVPQVPSALDLPLMQQVVKNLSDNQAISPFVMSSLLTQVWIGARGKTKDEMTPVLGLENAGTDDGQLDFLGGYSAAIDDLSSANGSITTGVFNRIYVRDGFTVKPSFSKTLETGYGAGAQIFSSAAEAVEEINTAVANVTRGRIPQLVTIDAVGQSPLVLVSALYFKADWLHPFMRTEKHPFLTADGDVQVDMMFQERLHLPYADFTEFQAVSVPYTDPNYIMLLLKPAKRSLESVQEFHQILGTLDIASIVDKLESTLVELAMPKFTIKTEYNLPNELINLNITEMFSPGADFAGISDDGGLVVSHVIHKVFIEVTEEGTEAAGAGAITFTRTAPRTTWFVLDMPFFAVVYNIKHNINMFTTFVANPTSDSESASN